VNYAHNQTAVVQFKKSAYGKTEVINLVKYTSAFIARYVMPQRLLASWRRINFNEPIMEF